MQKVGRFNTQKQTVIIKPISKKLIIRYDKDNFSTAARGASQKPIGNHLTIIKNIFIIDKSY